MATREKTLHWTQRPENKEKLQAMLAKAAAKRKGRKGKQPRPKTTARGGRKTHLANAVKVNTDMRRERRAEETHEGNSSEDQAVLFATGHVHGWLEAFSSRHNLVSANLSYRVGELLQAGSRGAVRGNS